MKKPFFVTIVLGLLLTFHGTRAQTIIDFNDMPGSSGYGSIFGDNNNNDSIFFSTILHTARRFR